MSKIRILPEQLANQIAAGEVVERPASVVKELLENSLDARAGRIEIEIEGGGTRLIRIIDDGDGMDEDDILLCLERHGTSKIKDDRDLVSISTLGFRGEAIPSIGSVSKMTILSRPDNSPLGTKVVYDYGKLLKVHEIGSSRGTIFEIRNLFGNTPARRKFLRTVRTELGHIEEIIKNYALGSPSVTFILRVNNKETLHLDGTHTLSRRLAHILHYKGDFIEIGKPLNNGHPTGLHGLIVPPETSLPGSAKLRLFVNGRAIKDRMMAHAVYEGLRGFLMKGRSPGGYLHLRLPVDEIDVNVHPAKHEIRFRNARDAHERINQAVISAMEGYQRNLQTTIFHPSPRDKRSKEVERRAVIPTQTARLSNSPPSTTSLEPSLRQNRRQREEFKNPFPSHKEKETQANLHPASMGFQTMEPPAAPSPVSSDQASQLSSAAITEHEHGLQVIGQFQNLYIFCQSEEGLVVIDQHAAHERLLYEKLRRQFTEGKVASQNLLFPETIELSLFQIQLVESNLQEIERMGFTIKEFGGNSYVISAIPALAGHANPRDLFTDFLETFGSEKEKRSGSSRLDTILATMACKAAVKSGDNLTPEEIDALLTRMARADLFSHCPHGRPVIKQFHRDDIKKWFFRT